MSDNPEWFAPKRYGFGSGLPITWQGWAVTAAFGALIAIGVYFFRDRPLQLAALMAPAILALVLVCARTTRGGWRWRWGGDD
ncbi:hypothetical protein [Sphingomonas flavescens]|uniref:hypothetical protein n=1 Tax=Sphingomonas flavescens TaxID=3132797 RepID=UPI0028043837|nr:hypothetical protein [Sphingomonas limnosediminicola]